jgi:YesN/AraC family two-component response regulator
MKEYVYETITHPTDLFREMQKTNQPINELENENKNDGMRELIDLGNDNWAICSSIHYFENIKQTMQTNYSRNWLRLMYVRNEEDDMVLDIEFSSANYEKKTNGKRVGFEAYKSETWIHQSGNVRILFVFLNEDFLKSHFRIDEIQRKILEMGKNIDFEKLNAIDGCFTDLGKSQKIKTILDIVIDSLKTVFPNENERLPEKSRLEIMGVMQAEQKLMQDFSAEAITLDELAKIAGVNRVKFQELFKRLYGNSFYVHYQKGRFNFAKKLILEENYNLCDAAYAVGFKNLTHFSRQFEKLIGIKPIQLKCRSFCLF